METLLIETLWRLTGKPYGKRKKSWIAWWKSESSDFSPIDKDELAKHELEEEERDQRQVSTVAQIPTVAQFFGIKIESERVIFVIDVSGSMGELIRPKFNEKYGKPRMEIAKRELTKVVKSLDPKTLFNILTYSAGVSRWRDEGVATLTKSARADALEYIARLGAGGTTDIYGALKLAFEEDPDIDMIVMLADGSPPQASSPTARSPTSVPHWQIGTALAASKSTQ